MTGNLKLVRKWRPPLALIVLTMPTALIALPMAIILGTIRVDLTTGWSMAAILAVALLLTLVVIYLLARTIIWPINTLIERTRVVARGGQAAIQSSEAYGTREVATLSKSISDLAMRMIERTEYIRSFTAHVSHELKSRLAAIQGAAECLREEEATMLANERHQVLEGILTDILELNVLLHRLGQLAVAERPTSAGQTKLAALSTAMTSRFPALRIVAEPHDATVPVQHEVGMIALIHLAENAVQHGADELRLTLDQTEIATTLVVSDNGSGISPHNRDKIFHPFFSTRSQVGGTGMGLAIARAALRSHGNDIALEPSETGAAFRITMPTD